MDPDNSYCYICTELYGYKEKYKQLSIQNLKFYWGYKFK